MKRNFLTAFALTLPLGLASAVTFTTDTFIPAGDSAYDNQDVVVLGCTLTVEGAHTFASLALSNNATLTHSPYGQGSDAAFKLELAVTGDMLVDVSSRVDVNGRGYACISGVSYGPGAGTGTLADSGGGGGGGAYGGNGGAPESPYAGGRAYGSPSAPTQHGSAGGAGYAGQGGAGGGYVRLVVGGTLLLDGQISANGSNGGPRNFGASGGGSGGGVWLTANQFSGAGQITANGGLGYVAYEEDSGAGGGGRIAVHCQNSAFIGTMGARGAAGGSIPARSGGAGSVFFKPNAADHGQLVIDNGGLEGVVTPWIQPAELGTLTVSNRATVEVLGGATLLVPGQTVIGPLGTLLCRATNINALIEDSWQGLGATITSATLRVEVGGLITATGQGYVGTVTNGCGPGGGTGTRADITGGGGGGAHGGNGGLPQSPYAGGFPYGSLAQPVTLGSAGGAGYAANGAAGGGAIRVVTGSLTVDGVLSADGADGGASSLGAAGGGAGGSLLLETETLAGSGVISARGGVGPVVNEEDGGGGGGGRIALYSATNNYVGLVRAHGGSGFQAGGAGSVYWHASPSNRGTVVYDNAGLANSLTTWIGPNDRSQLVLTNGTLLELPGGGLLSATERITIATNGTLLCRATNINALIEDSWQGLGATITSATLRVEVGGLITATGQGYVGTVTNGCGPGGGTGTRKDITGGGGGGAHGGNGGKPQSPYVGGLAYGSVTQPLAPGSAGGAGYPANGGAGGGAVKIMAAALELEGQITANGLPGGASSLGAAGGGAGGSLWLELGTLTGGGLLAANGGDSYVVNEEDGGGGAGGRIAIEYTANAFAGQLQAYGGLSGNGGSQGQAGGAGTIFLQSATQTTGNLIVDNRGVLGALTPWPSALSLDATTVGAGGNLEIHGETSWTGTSLTLTDGAVMHLGDAATLRLNSLTMTSNALVYCHGQNASGLVDEAWVGRGVTLEAQSANIGAGAVITADGQGYTGTNTKGNGPGAGDGWRTDSNGGGSGAAYGGNGGNAEGPWIPGSAYGSVAQPLDLGSAGGAGLAGSGANGGGAFRLIVVGECLLDGTITAKGLNGAFHNYGPAGGGAGGSVWISAGTFSGAGTVDARGGDGAIASEEDSGGGGGGRIAVEASANSFAGTLLAQGGGGGVRGGAGTVYLRTAPQTVGNLIVDNGGLAGARTPLTGKEAFDHVQVQNRGLLGLLAGQAFSAASVTVATNGTLAPQGGTTLLAGDLTVESGGVMQCESTNSSSQIGGEWAGYGSELLIGTVVVQPGGVLTATGLGYTGTDGRGNGPGGGSGTRNDANGGGGGGGYGGAGGPGEGNQPGGQSYGSAIEPVDLGSAGGAGYAGRGGAGGGTVRIIATNQVVVDGLISADGAAGVFHRYGASGGGAGGSIWISTRKLTGASGSIQAAGGQGWVASEEDSGGGGGGRIALDCANFDFSGSLSVAGWANGAFSGQPGTIFTNQAIPCVVTPIGGTAAGRTVEFTLQFAESVTGLTQDDVLVVNGTKLALTGGGDTYVLTVRAVGGMVTCLVPAAVAHSAGIPNARSNPGFAHVTPPELPLLSVELQPAGLHLAWPGEPGLNYQLQSATDLSPATWLNEGTPFAGTDGVLSTNIPIGSGTRRFFRLQVVN